MTAHEMWEQMMAAKSKIGGEHLTGYAELTWDESGVRHTPDGHGGYSRHVIQMKQGQTVKIVMASRFGDLGITPELDEEYGYITRVFPEQGLLVNCRYTR